MYETDGNNYVLTLFLSCTYAYVCLQTFDNIWEWNSAKELYLRILGQINVSQHLNNIITLVKCY